MSILKLKKIRKHFNGVLALDNLSLEIRAEKITGIVGPNGSGKTTLINILSGCESLDGGTIIVDDSLRLKKMKAYENSIFGIARTFQEIRLFEQMTVLDNVLVILTEKNVWDAIFEKHGEYHLMKAEELLKVVNLWDKRNELVINLSYGQGKLLEIARALSTDAKIYLFDEPFAGLFPEMIKTVMKIIKKLKEEGKTIILVEHNMLLMRELCDEIIVMDNGKLLSKGKPEEVLNKKKVLEVYLGK
ncbi:MAG: ABC transporter ATP-binding protein [Candidatus Moraniibacteriota bacterium]